MWISLYSRWTASGSFELGIYWSRFLDIQYSSFSVQCSVRLNSFLQLAHLHVRNVVLRAGLPLESPARFLNLASGHATSVCTTHSLARHPSWAGHPALADWIGGVPSHLRSGRLVSAGPLLPVPGLSVRGAGWLRYDWFRWSLITAGFRSG